MNTAEFAVIGLGSVGSFAFGALAEAGRNVIGFEGAGIANDRCAVGGDTRLFRRLYREGPNYHDLLERSLERWTAIAAQIPDAFTQCGAVNIVAPDSEAANDLRSYGQQFGIDHRVLDSTELFAKYPQFRHHEGVIGFEDPSGGFIRTDVVVRNAVDQGLRDGGRLIEAGVSSIRSGAQSVEITDERGETWSVDRVIVATGARSLPLLPELSAAASPRRLLMTWFQALRPEEFTPDAMPVFTYDHGPLHAYGAPSIDGRHVKVSGIVPHQELHLSGDDYDPAVTGAELEFCQERIAEIFSGLHTTPVRTAVYPDLYSEDQNFILDFTDSEQRIFAATGFSGKGFKMCSALGEHAAQVITDQSRTIPEFSLDRFTA